MYACHLFASPSLFCCFTGGGYRHRVVVMVVFVTLLHHMYSEKDVVEMVEGMSCQRSTAMSQINDIVTVVMAQFL